MATRSQEQRTHPRTRVNWPMEYTGVSKDQGLVHEGTKLADYSQGGACFLTMCNLEVGMKLNMHITLPVRMARTLQLQGIVVRVDKAVDVGGMFRAAAVRWIPGIRKTVSSLRAAQRKEEKVTSH
jgi:hypothetical protein